jgi:hypothetical protein
MELDEMSRAELEFDFLRRKVFDALRALAGYRETRKRRKLHLRFLPSPVGASQLIVT